MADLEANSATVKCPVVLQVSSLREIWRDATLDAHMLLVHYNKKIYFTALKSHDETFHEKMSARLTCILIKVMRALLSLGEQAFHEPLEKKQQIAEF